MKRLIFFIGFLLSAMFLLEFNYGCSKNNFEKTIKYCKKVCEIDNDLEFCKRICEIEIVNPRWIFLGFDNFGSAFFYDSKSLSTSHKIVKVWVKIIYSEREKQQYFGRKYENLDYRLNLLKINCTEKNYQILSTIYYTSDGSIIKSYNYSELLAELNPIIPDSAGEVLFKKVCQVKE